MPDNQVDILIKFGLNKDQATQAVSEIKKVKEATTEASKEGVKGQESVADAVKENHGWHRQLREMVKGLGAQYPELGHLAHLALNPITLLTASIAGGFAIWTRRVHELTLALGGIEMPDLHVSDSERIEQQATAWGKLAQQMADAATASNALKKSYELTIKLIESNDKFAKALGIDTGSQSTDQKAAAAAKQANDLEADARARLARAGRPGSETDEKLLDARYKAATAAAEKAQAESKARIDDILQVQEESRGGISLGGIGAAMRYSLRYGRIKPEQALALENQNIASQQGIIDAGARFAGSSAERAVRRGEITGANAQLSEVERLRQENQFLRQDSATQRAATGMGLINSGAGGFGGSLEGFAGSAGELARGVIMLNRAVVDMNRANRELKSRVDAKDKSR